MENTGINIEFCIIGWFQFEFIHKYSKNLDFTALISNHSASKEIWKDEVHKLNTRLTFLISKCLSKGSCLILLGKFPSKLNTTLQPPPCIKFLLKLLNRIMGNDKECLDQWKVTFTLKNARTCSKIMFFQCKASNNKAKTKLENKCNMQISLWLVQHKC